MFASVDAIAFPGGLAISGLHAALGAAIIQTTLIRAAVVIARDVGLADGEADQAVNARFEHPGLQ